MAVQLLSSLRSLPRKSYGARAWIVQCHLRHIYGPRSYDFSKFVKLLAKPNRRGRGARDSVQKSHSRLLPPQGGLAEAARKGRYGQDTGSVDPSQAKCELGINWPLVLRNIRSAEVFSSRPIDFIVFQKLLDVSCHYLMILFL